MTLTTGTRLGPYEILGPLGAGGMGVVWRARDTRLDRLVAIKALPDEFARDPERLARFEREARLLASLTHPNIAAIYGLEEADGHQHLVLEFVDGDTLADRLRRGPMPLADALDACRQIAAALEAAHESGVIHRDLKPGNVKLTPAGEIKVLDFGLAKGAVGDSSGAGVLTQSPTMTLGMTGAGVILGTAAYMSPEQARGRAVDRRTDIWSFGCVLYECLTGRQTFEGETVSDMIARILEREPDWSALPANVPAPVRELLQRCLDKDAKQRLRDVGDARLALERAIAERTSGPRVAIATGASPRRAGLRITLAVVSGIALGAAAWALAERAMPRPAPVQFTHLSITFPADPEIVGFVLSPDGRRLVCRGVPVSDRNQGRDAQRLYIRERSSFDLREVPGTRSVRGFGITPDGRWIIFEAPLSPGAQDSRIARVPIDGSAPPVTVAPMNPNWQGGIALHDGTLLMVDESLEHMTPISAQGRVSEPVAIDRGTFRGRIRELRQVISSDRAVLLDMMVYRNQGWVVQAGVLDLRTRKFTVLLEDGGNPRLIPDGTLLFSRGDVLLAVRFDEGRLAIRGTPIAVESGLRSQFTYLPAQYYVDPAGDLYFVPGGALANQRRLGVVMPDGKVIPLPAPAAAYQDFPSPSASGNEFAVKITNPQGIDEVWFGSVQRPALRRVVSWPNADAVGISCSPRGTRVAYTRYGRDGQDGVYLAETGASGVGHRIVVPESSSVDYRPESWTVDEKYLVMSRTPRGGHSDLWIVRIPGGDSVAVPRPLLTTTYDEYASDFSPDGRWMAWQSNGSGRNEIYAAPFLPEGALGSVIQITDQGAEVPEWTGDGRSLSVRDAGQHIVTMYEIGMPPRPGDHPVREWFDMEKSGVRDFTLMPDGRGLAILRGEREKDQIESCNVILGWTSTLRKRLAAAR